MPAERLHHRDAMLLDQVDRAAEIVHVLVFQHQVVHADVAGRLRERQRVVAAVDVVEPHVEVIRHDSVGEPESEYPGIELVGFREVRYLVDDVSQPLIARHEPAAHGPSRAERVGGGALAPGQFVAKSPRVGEPGQFGDAAVAQDRCVGPLQAQSAAREMLGERVQIGLVGQAPAGVSEFVGSAGVDADAEVDVVDSEPDRTVGRSAVNHRADDLGSVGRPVRRAR
nr:hypothetical protein [Gordonia sp. YC-JH1]